MRKKKIIIWKGKNSIVTLESDYPDYVFGAPKRHTWYLQSSGFERVLASWPVGDKDKFLYMIGRWKNHKKIWELIEEDVKSFLAYYFS